MENGREKYEGDVGVRLKTSKRLENFWYHYKWHTIAALAVIFIVTFLFAQSCSRTSFDVHIMYAGHHEIKRTSADGDTAPYGKIVDELERIAPDLNGDGKRNVNLLNLFVIDAEEAEKIIAGRPEAEINEALVREDTETFNFNIVSGDYYLMFLSERLYLECEGRYGDKLFLPLTEYASGVEGVRYAGERQSGIYLSSLDFYSCPATSDLPSDTVVVLKKVSDVSNCVGKKGNTEKFRAAEEMLKSILAY